MFLVHALAEMVRRSAVRRNSSRRWPTRRRRNRPLIMEGLEERTLLSYSFELIAATGGAYSALRFVPFLNSEGLVAFQADLRDGGEAVFRTGRHGRLTTIADTRGPLQAFVFAPVMNDDGTVSIGADLRAGYRGIFIGSGGKLTPIADTGPDSPFSTLPTPAAPIYPDRDTVSFRASLRSGGEGMFTGDGGRPTILYVSGGRFAGSFSVPAPIAGGSVAFSAALTKGGEGVFTGDGGPPTTIADTSDGAYSAFSPGGMTDAGTVAFRATRSKGGQAILTGYGESLTWIADTDGPYSSFGVGPGINNAGTVVFLANLDAGGSGLFTGPDPVANKIIASGDPLFGSTLTTFLGRAFPPRGLNDEGQLVFIANLADGRRVVVVAEPDGAAGSRPLPSGDLAALLIWDLQLVSSLPVGTPRELRSAGEDTPAHPDRSLLEAVTLSSVRPDQSGRPPTALSHSARGTVLELVLTEDAVGSLDATLRSDLALAAL